MVSSICHFLFITIPLFLKVWMSFIFRQLSYSGRYFFSSTKSQRFHPRPRPPDCPVCPKPRFVGRYTTFYCQTLLLYRVHHHCSWTHTTYISPFFSSLHFKRRHQKILLFSRGIIYSFPPFLQPLICLFISLFYIWVLSSLLEPSSNVFYIGMEAQTDKPINR